MFVMEIVDFTEILVTCDTSILHNFWEDSNPYVFISQLLIKRGNKHQSYTNKFYFSDAVWLPQAPPPPPHPTTQKTQFFRGGPQKKSHLIKFIENWVTFS